MSSADINTVIEQLSHATVDETAVVTFAGRGLKLDNENDAVEIVNAILKCTNLNVLELKGNTLGVEAAKAIGVALEKRPEFKRALWSDMFTGRLKSEIPGALKYLCGGLMTAQAQLVELDLSDNAFGPNGMIGLTDFLRSSSCYSLRELRLNNNGLGIQGGKMLAESLLACYNSSVAAGHALALKLFVSGRGRLEDEGAVALAEAFKAMRSLEEVHMSQNGINHRGITALAEAFAVNTCLRHINLSDNTFTVKGSAAMAKALPHLSQLEVINFDDCLTRTDGAKLLASSLTDSCSQLKVLRLSGNEINRHGAEAVSKAVCNKPHLEELDLNCNQLGSDGIEAVQNLLKVNGKLEQLKSLSDDEGTDDEDNDDDDVVEDDTDDAERTDEDVENGAEGSDELNHQKCDTSELEVRGKALTIHSTPPTTTVEEFLNSPAKFKELGDNKQELFIDYFNDHSCDVEKVLAAFLKLLQVECQSDESLRGSACQCADAVLSRAFEQIEESSVSSVMTNGLLVHLGLLKSEDKKFVARVTGDSLSIVQHVAQQPYFPQSVRDCLAFFISQSETKTGKPLSAGWQQLLQTLNSTKQSEQ